MYQYILICTNGLSVRDYAASMWELKSDQLVVGENTAGYGFCVIFVPGGKAHYCS